MYSSSSFLPSLLGSKLFSYTFRGFTKGWCVWNSNRRTRRRNRRPIRPAWDPKNALMQNASCILAKGQRKFQIKPAKHEMQSCQPKSENGSLTKSPPRSRRIQRTPQTQPGVRIRSLGDPWVHGGHTPPRPRPSTWKTSRSWAGNRYWSYH